MSFLKAITFRKNSSRITLVKRGVLLAIVSTALAGCVVDPYPPAYPAPVAAAPAPYGCCYSYPEYPAYYGPSIGLQFGGYGGYRGGYGGYHGGGWGGGGRGR